MSRESGSGSPLEYLQQARDRAEKEAEDARQLLFELAPRLKDIAELDTKLKAVIDYLTEDAAAKQDTGEQKGTSGNTLQTIAHLLLQIERYAQAGEVPHELVDKLVDIVEATIDNATEHALGKIKNKAEAEKDAVRLPR